MERSELLAICKELKESRDYLADRAESLEHMAKVYRFQWLAAQEFIARHGLSEEFGEFIKSA